MPRQIDLFPQNFKLTNDPNAAAQANPQTALDAFTVPTLLEDLETIINQFLTNVDKVTGLNLLGVAQFIENILNSADALFAPIIHALTNGVGTVVADIATWASDLVTLVQNIIDAIWNAIQQTVGVVENTITDVVSLLFGQHHTLNGHSTLIAEIQAQLSPGVSASDQFNRSDSSSLGGNWSEYYSNAGHGTLGIGGDEASWYVSGASSNHVVASWAGTNAASNTDYQSISIIMGTQNDSDFLGHSSYMDLIGRLDNTPAAYSSANYIRVRVEGASGFLGRGGSNTAYIQASIAGSITAIATVSLPATPTKGTVFNLQLGKKSSSTPAWITFSMNNAVLYSAADTSGSNYGSSYRGWGFGVGTDGGLLSQIVPGNVALWTGQDQ